MTVANSVYCRDASGEEIHQELEHSAKEETLRGCAELVFNSLIDTNRKDLSQVVVQLAGQVTLVPSALPVSGGVSQTNTEALHAAAVLHAIAVGAYELYDHFDFDALLSKSILPLISARREAYPPLRRSALKVVSYWVPKLKPQDRPSVYSAIIETLEEGDPGIFLMSCSVLQALLEDWDFDPAQFLSFIPTTVDLLVRILSACGEYESQLEVFSLLNLVIDHMGDQTLQCAPCILHLIPSLWTSSEGQSLLRIQIMLALQRLVHALGRDSPLAYSVIFPVLSDAIHCSNPDALNLLEDGVLLWLVALRHAPGPEPHLMAPMSQLLRIMSDSTEYISTGTRCITSCALLFGDVLLEQYGQYLCSVFNSYIGQVKDKAMLEIIPTVDIIMQACPKIGLDSMCQVLLTLVLDIVGGNEPANVVAAALPLLARMSILETSKFVQLFELCSQSHQTVVTNILLNFPRKVAEFSLTENLFVLFLDTWLEKVDSIAQAFPRKLSALGLSSILGLKARGVLERFDEIIANVTSVWFELEGPEAEPDPLGLSFPLAGAGPRDDHIPVAVDLEEAEAEPNRRRELFEKNLILELRISTFFKQKLQEAFQVHGEAVQAAMNSVDPSIAEQLRLMLSAT